MYCNKFIFYVLFNTQNYVKAVLGIVAYRAYYSLEEKLTMSETRFKHHFR